METNNNLTSKAIRQGAYVELVEKIYREDNTPMRYNGSIESMLREFFSKTSKKKYLWKRNTFKQLLIHMYNQKCYALLRHYNSVEVLQRISAFGNHVSRPIEDWENSSGNEEVQLNTMIRHCFATYETPEFLERAFYSSEKKYMLWYVQLGKGKSVKHLSNMPIRLTNKMAHEFRNAPCFLNVNQALRYAQAIGFGASTKIARLIAYSRLSVIREDQEDFWATVVLFFSKEIDLNVDVNEVDGVIDYLTHKYREEAAFSMKNRTYSALLSQSQEWHRLVYQQERAHRYSWKSSGIKPLYVEEVVDNKAVVYKTEELLSSDALFDEGYAMQHCVSEYDEDCEEGRCSIFSLRQEVDGEPMKRLVTLEVELPSYQIVQAKAKCNQEPDYKSMELINHWIDHSQLRRKAEIAPQQAYRPQQHVEQPVRARAYEVRQDPVFSRDSVYIIWLIIKVLLLIGKAMSM